MKNPIITITGTTDQERTNSLRAGLAALGYEPGPYTWECGRPLCFAEPSQDWFDYNSITLILNPKN